MCGQRRALTIKRPEGRSVGMTSPGRIPGPAVAANRLRSRLVRFREAAQLTQVNVATELDWSESKLHRIENGPGRVQTSDLLAMLTLYGISDEPERQAMVELARASRQPGISTRYGRQLPPRFVEYLDYESFADHVYNYEVALIPGPIQMSGYADAVVAALLGGEAEERQAAIVYARNERAQYLTGPQGPSVDFIIDEVALHRAVGGEELSWDLKYSTMERLTEHLKELNTRGRAKLGQSIRADLNPDISIQLVPLEWGAYSALRGPFVILEFNSPDDDPLVYLENPTGEEILRSPSDTSVYTQLFRRLSESIPGAEQTNDLLDYIRASYVRRLAEYPANVRRAP